MERERTWAGIAGLMCGIVILLSPVLASTTPVAAFLMNVTVGPAPLEVQFSDISTGGNLSYMWDFGDGFTGTVVSPVHIYTDAGTYLVILTVHNDAGTSSISLPVEVQSSAYGYPEANFTVNAISGSAPLSVQFTDHSSGENLSYQWIFGDGGVSDLSSPVHLYQEAGTYTASLNVTNPLGSDLHQISIQVHGEEGISPVADFIANRTEGTAPAFISFTDLSTGSINEYRWDFGDNTTSTERDPLHLFSSPGLYSVSLYVQGSSGGDWENKTDYIQITGIEANFTADPTFGKVPLTVQFLDTSSEENITYFWDFGEGSTSLDPDPLFTYTVPGRYTVSHRIVNQANVSSWENRTEYIRAYSFDPEVNFEADPAEGTAPLTVHFTDLSSIEGIVSWTWNFGDGATGTGETPVHTYSKTGTFSVTLNISTSNDTFSTTKYDFLSVAEKTKAVTTTVKPKAVITTRSPVVASTTPSAATGIGPKNSFGFFGLMESVGEDGGRQIVFDRGALQNGGISIPEGDLITLEYPSCELILHTTHRTVQEDTLVANLTSLRLISPPVSGPFSRGTFYISLDSEILSFTDNPRIDASLTFNPPASVQAKFQEAVEMENLTVSDISGAIKYESVNLTAGRTAIAMGVPSSWVEQHGGKNSLRILRVDDSGSARMLNISSIVQNATQVTLEAVSPAGISWFALISTSAANGTSEGGQNIEGVDPLPPFAAYMMERSLYLVLIAFLSAGIVGILLYLRELDA